MDKTMRDADLDDSDEEYDENADEDFNPDQAAADDGEHSSSDEEDAGKSRGKRKVDALADELDSGDEATIKERQRIRKKQKKERQDEVDGAESAGEEWRVKTRSQKLVEKAEKKQRRRAAAAGNVTIDVDQMWADLSAVPVGRVALPPPKLPVEEMDVDHERDPDNASTGREDELVTIKERIHYAGTIEEVEKQVLRSSKEAQDYFAAHPEASSAAGQRLAGTSHDAQGLHRPLKRPSMFEPNPLSLVKGVPAEKLRPRAPSRVDVQMAEQRARDKKGAVKMSTVQKSALDWRGFVDKQGLRDELDAYGRSNKGFLDREAFLDRAAATREQAARDARLKI